MATPMPPPMHRVASPFLPPERFSSCSRVVRMRAPEAPIGWPMAMAPPLTFTLAGSRPSSFSTHRLWAAKASLDSTRSRSATVQPAFSSALRDAGIGPVPMMAGSTPALAQERMVARGSRPRALASSADMSTIAAAPSLSPEALAAVTEPSLVKAGRSFSIDSSVAPWRMYSSLSTVTSPFLPAITTGTISSSNFPDVWAASALCWLARAKASWSARLIWYFSAMFSAVWPMW